MQKTVKFKELRIGDVFYFTRERQINWRYYGLACGPWEKVSARKYRVYVDPFSGDYNTDRNLENQVGSINVSVFKEEE